MGGAAGGAEALIVDRCAHDQEVAAGETSHPALITYTNLIDSDHMGNLSPPTPGHWRYPSFIIVAPGIDDAWKASGRVIYHPAIILLTM